MGEPGSGGKPSKAENPSDFVESHHAFEWDGGIRHFEKVGKYTHKVKARGGVAEMLTKNQQTEMLTKRHHERSSGEFGESGNQESLGCLV